MGLWARGGLAVILGSLAACSSPPLQPPSPSPDPAVTAASPKAAARWVAVGWQDLPGWGSDDLLAAWPALLASCQRPAPGWAEFCARVALQPPADAMEAALLLMKHLRPWRLQTDNGEATGLLTGYFEPQLAASRQRQGAYQWPLHALPADPVLRRMPRRDIDAHPRFAALELAYLDDPFALLQLQIQGSGRLVVRDAAGAERITRVAFAGHNDQPFQSVARTLLGRGELRDASWPALSEWARRNPAKVRDALAVNPRVVYFREEALPDVTVGPRGAQGVPLTPGRSVAVDRSFIPLGAPLWLDSTEPLSPTPLRRLVLAQDTGGAILGAVRADLFWGWSDEAALQAGRTKQPLRLWALWPAGAIPKP
ncbi:MULTISPECIES: murein transglycosylase A [unclassified Roseateles]|uniref:murein transglycosylase A n=1 Tax=unclassified Roseateles TaxID=2626991 RepID=UPI0006F8FE61|nr:MULTISPECIES: MltA domain-containing protein [unclassified Roseateles]KQW46491.1 transglycosylase [Pelomonas sp. Root405]KRA73542.1 transglycosylase [Pelomonas sp. Root662]